MKRHHRLRALCSSMQCVSQRSHCACIRTLNKLKLCPLNQPFGPGWGLINNIKASTRVVFSWAYLNKCFYLRHLFCCPKVQRLSKMWLQTTGSHWFISVTPTPWQAKASNVIKDKLTLGYTHSMRFNSQSWNTHADSRFQLSRDFAHWMPQGWNTSGHRSAPIKIQWCERTLYLSSLITGMKRKPYYLNAVSHLIFLHSPFKVVLWVFLFLSTVKDGRSWAQQGRVSYGTTQNGLLKVVIGSGGIYLSIITQVPHLDSIWGTSVKVGYWICFHTVAFLLLLK